MKIEKELIADRIEQIIGDGVISGEDVDVTTKKVIDDIWPIISYLKDENILRENKTLKSQIDYMSRKLDQCDPHEVIRLHNMLETERNKNELLTDVIKEMSDRK